MADRRVSVKLEVTDNFTGRMRAAMEAAEVASREWLRAQATWEPHDWGDF